MSIQQTAESLNNQNRWKVFTPPLFICLLTAYSKCWVKSLWALNLTIVTFSTAIDGLPHFTFLSSPRVEEQQYAWIWFPPLTRSPLLLETTIPLPLLNGIPVLMHESWHVAASLSSFPSFTFILFSLSLSLSLSNGLTRRRWLCVATSSEVLMGHTHDGQVNKPAGLGGGRGGVWSKVGITGKSQSSMQGRSPSCGMITSGIACDPAAL